MRLGQFIATMPCDSPADRNDGGYQSRWPGRPARALHSRAPAPFRQARRLRRGHGDGTGNPPPLLVFQSLWSFSPRSSVIGSCRGPRTVPTDHLTTAPGVKAKIEEFAEPFLQRNAHFIRASVEPMHRSMPRERSVPVDGPIDDDAIAIRKHRRVAFGRAKCQHHHVASLDRTSVDLGVLDDFTRHGHRGIGRRKASTAVGSVAGRRPGVCGRRRGWRGATSKLRSHSTWCLSLRKAAVAARR